MNEKKFEISKRSRYSWTNLHAHCFVPCRKCGAPYTPAEFGPAVNEVGKVVASRLPDKCADCLKKKKERTA